MNGIACAVGTLLLLAGSSSQAAGWFEKVRVIGGVSGGYTTFDFPEKLDHEIHFPSAELVLAATVSQWQLNLSWTNSLLDAELSEEEDTGNATRSDLDFTLGYQLNRQWSIFAGLKDGETKIDFIPREEGISTSESYAQQGPYIGASYSWRFENAGSLNVSLAYAYLDASNIFSANTDNEEGEDENEAIEFDDLTGRIDGNTSGFSYSASWTMPLSSSLLYQTRLKVNSYRQDVELSGREFPGIDETLIRLSVGLAYVF
ncbi:MAG: hypothetical protein KTR32_03630 [Granulosicoccus sp.]|nr:hypothetical protein [Granulosicoccus sp.]